MSNYDLHQLRLSDLDTLFHMTQLQKITPKLMYKFLAQSESV